MWTDTQAPPFRLLGPSLFYSPSVDLPPPQATWDEWASRISLPLVAVVWQRWDSLAKYNRFVSWLNHAGDDPNIWWEYLSGTPIITQTSGSALNCEALFNTSCLVISYLCFLILESYYSIVNFYFRTQFAFTPITSRLFIFPILLVTHNSLSNSSFLASVCNHSISFSPCKS